MRKVSRFRTDEVGFTKAPLPVSIFDKKIIGGRKMKHDFYEIKKQIGDHLRRMIDIEDIPNGEMMPGMEKLIKDEFTHDKRVDILRRQYDRMAKKLL